MLGHQLLQQNLEVRGWDGDVGRPCIQCQVALLQDPAVANHEAALERPPLRRYHGGEVQAMALQRPTRGRHAQLEVGSLAFETQTEAENTHVRLPQPLQHRRLRVAEQGERQPKHAVEKAVVQPPDRTCEDDGLVAELGPGYAHSVGDDLAAHDPDTVEDRDPRNVSRQAVHRRRGTGAELAVLDPKVGGAGVEDHLEAPAGRADFHVAQVLDVANVCEGLDVGQLKRLELRFWSTGGP
mmetsp:Transcript_11362/g.32522  ORF Transcript_11362/g.32522 Transcript_11362/m.32522 type:complete len:239 (-) Transcript_11362:278-994(-)